MLKYIVLCTRCCFAQTKCNETMPRLIAEAATHGPSTSELQWYTRPSLPGTKTHLTQGQATRAGQRATVTWRREPVAMTGLESDSGLPGERRPDGSVGMALVLPALTDCWWWFVSLLVHLESQVRPAERQRAPTKKKSGLPGKKGKVETKKGEKHNNRIQARSKKQNQTETQKSRVKTRMF